MNRKTVNKCIRRLSIVCSASLTAAVFFADGAEPADYVNSFVGTDAAGDTYPGPVWPLGMVQPGPDTGERYWSSCQGYHWRHTTVTGFSQTHLSGTGCPDFQDVALNGVPFTDFILRHKNIMHGGELTFQMWNGGRRSQGEK